MPKQPLTEEKEAKQESVEYKPFPILPGKKSKYHQKNSDEFYINFGDYIYFFNARALHYIVDHESLGWSLMPPDDLINRVMIGGKFKLEYSPLEQLTLQGEAVGCLRKRKLKNQKDYQIFDSENKTPAKLGKAPDCFIERLEKIAAAFFNKEKSIGFPPHPDYVDKAILRRPESELCYCHTRFEKLRLENEEKGIDVRETKAKIHLTLPKDRKRHSTGVVDLNSVFYSDAPYELAGHTQFVSVTDSMAYCDLRSALFFQLEHHARSAFEFIFKYEDGVNYLREIFNRIFKSFNIEFDTGFSFARANPLVLVVRGENLTRLKAIGAKIIPSKNRTPGDKLYLAFGVTSQKCEIEKNLIEIENRSDGYSLIKFSNWLQRQSGLIKGEDCQSITSNNNLAFDNEGIGDRFLKLLQDRIRAHDKIFKTLYAVEHGGLCYRASASVYHMFCCRKPAIVAEKKKEALAPALSCFHPER